MKQTIKKDNQDQSGWLALARKNYKVGNFYQTRKIVYSVLQTAGLTPHENTEAHTLLYMTGVDKWALSCGLASVALTLITAFVVGN